jgi:ABC-type sugar transport system substrate-binding protein
MRRLLLSFLAILCLSLAMAPAAHVAASKSVGSSLHGTINYWNAYGNGNSAEAQALTTKVVPRRPRQESLPSL